MVYTIYIPSDIGYVQYTYLQIYVLMYHAYNIWYIQYTYLQIYGIYNIHTFRYMYYAYNIIWYIQYTYIPSDICIMHTYILYIYIYIYICILNTVYTHVHPNKHSDMLVKLILRRSNVFIIDFLDFILSGCYFYIL